MPVVIGWRFIIPALWRDHCCTHPYRGRHLTILEIDGHRTAFSWKTQKPDVGGVTLKNEKIGLKSRFFRSARYFEPLNPPFFFVFFVFGFHRVMHSSLTLCAQLSRTFVVFPLLFEERNTMVLTDVFACVFQICDVFVR